MKHWSVGIPRELVVCGRTDDAWRRPPEAALVVPVLTPDQILEPNGNELRGCYEDCVIPIKGQPPEDFYLAVSKALPRHEVAEIFLHELLHVLFDVKAIPKSGYNGRLLWGEERIVRSLAEGLADVFANNPRLLFWLFEAIFSDRTPL